MRKILLFMIFGMLVLSYPTANTDAQTGQNGEVIERVDRWEVLGFESDHNCGNVSGNIIAPMTQTIEFASSYTFYNHAVYTPVQDGLIYEVVDGNGTIFQRTAATPVDPGRTFTFEGTIDFYTVQEATFVRPISVIGREGSTNREVARTTFDPAEFDSDCAYLPYVGPIEIDNTLTLTDDASIHLGNDDNGNPSLDVYGINDDGEGYYQFSITQDLLAPYADNPPTQNTELASADNVTLYMLTTGEYQLNIGPDDEGKVRVIVFEGLPPTNVYSYDFNVYDVLGE